MTPNEKALFLEIKSDRDAWKSLAERLAGALKHTVEFCLCERFSTHGFDYGEKHMRMGKAKSGARWLTPDIVAREALAEFEKAKLK